MFMGLFNDVEADNNLVVEFWEATKTVDIECSSVDDDVLIKLDKSEVKALIKTLQKCVDKMEE